MRLSKSLCAVVGSVLAGRESHQNLEALFISAGASGDPPGLAHRYKWKEWLFRTGNDPNVNSLGVLGAVLEEFMDISPKPDTPGFDIWKGERDLVEKALEENGLRYYRFGRVLPQGEPLPDTATEHQQQPTDSVAKPEKIEELLEVIIQGLPRAMHPLTHRRKGTQPLSFSNEYDVQDLLHSMLRPWIRDIRQEEFTPSCAGTSTRMDFLLPSHALVIETKIVRDRTHAKGIGKELIIDIEHYRKHPKCNRLWCVIYDSNHMITNAEGLKNDLEGSRSSNGGEVTVRVFVL